MHLFIVCLCCVCVFASFVRYNVQLPSHSSTAQLQQSGLVAKLRELLDNGPRQRYHASRGLVYMGELDLGSVSIFDENGEE